jgi:S-formylglutathione hydrolase FrmB
VPLSRRAVLLSGVGAVVAACAGGYELVQHGALPGKYFLARIDGACGSAPPAPAGPGPDRRTMRFYSVYRRREVEMVTLVPHGAASLPSSHKAPATASAGAESGHGLGVVIALHGAGGSAAQMAGLVAPAMTSAQVTGFAVICVDGGDTYWHARADGDDPVGMILYEVLPRARASRLATRRIGITGLSMGGYGALLMAEQLSAPPGLRSFAGTPNMPTPPLAPAALRGPSGPTPAVAAVAALSPAIFTTYADAEAADRSSFDSPADFARNNVFDGVDALRRVPTWITCGADDPFQPETSLLLTRLAAVTGHRVQPGILSGCHDDAFWGRNMPAGLSFIETHLA